MGTWIYFREGKAAKGEEMGAAFHMPCPLKQWFSTSHCPYSLSILWDPLPFYLPYTGHTLLMSMLKNADFVNMCT